MWLEQLVDWTRLGLPCALVTIIDSAGSTPRGVGAKMVVSASDAIAGTVGGGSVEHHCRKVARDAIRDGRCALVRFVLQDDAWSEETEGTIVMGACGGRLTVFVEPIVPQKEVVIFGAGHVAERLGRLCDATDVPYRVFDDRPDYPTEARFPGARERIVAEWDHVTERVSLSVRSYCVVMTYGHRHDGEVLEQLLKNPDVAYIGMMGSAEKVRALFGQLSARGISVDSRVYSPIGLGIGGRLPGGIALAILAEVQLLMHGGSPNHLRLTSEAH